MITNPMELRASCTDLGSSVWTLTAIAALFESGLVDQLREPKSADDLERACPALTRTRIQRCLALAATVGIVSEDNGKYHLAPGVMPALAGPMRAALEGDMRSTLMQSLRFLESVRGDRPETGWTHTDRALLQAQGDASGGFPPMFKAMIVGQLGDLAARLEQPGAAFLDVGVGVASLAIGMARAFPQVRVVGLDMFDVPLAIARENVTKAGLGDRVELRKGAVEQLEDDGTYELAWLPSFFIESGKLPESLRRVRASLRPGGWLVMALGTSGGDARHRGALGLMTDLWGGPALTVEEAQALLAEAGFTTSRAIPAPAWAPSTVAAQR